VYVTLLFTSAHERATACNCLPVVASLKIKNYCNCEERCSFHLKMHQKLFGSWAPPGPTGGAYSTPPEPLAGFKR